jgi:hypothetical protein
MVLGCGNEHTTDTHGWKTCGDHAPAAACACPGRYNFEIMAARIADGYVTVVTDVAL